MDSMFADIESYSVDSNSEAVAQRSISTRSRRASTSRTSAEDLIMETDSTNAAIGDEQAAEQLRQHELLRRIVALEALFFEDYARPLEASSRLAFECFMKYSPNASMPLLGAEPSGTLIATWTLGGECLSLRFSDRYRLDYAVTYRAGHEDIRRWGRSSLVNVLSECPAAKRLISC